MSDEMIYAKDKAFREWLPLQNGNVGQESYEPWSDGFESGYQRALTSKPQVSEGEIEGAVWNQTGNYKQAQRVVRALLKQFEIRRK